VVHSAQFHNNEEIGLTFALAGMNFSKTMVTVIAVWPSSVRIPFDQSTLFFSKFRKHVGWKENRQDLPVKSWCVWLTKHGVVAAGRAFWRIGTTIVLPE
jgi:hypothetical protein